MHFYKFKDKLKIFYEAMTSKDATFQKEAPNDKIDAILSINTCILVYLSLGSKLIGRKWVIKKYNYSGSLCTFNARLVVKGFRQEDIGYFDTYGLVARITSTRMFSIFKLCIR